MRDGQAVTLDEHESFAGHAIGLEVDGVLITRITEVSGLKVDQDVIELKQNTSDGKYIVRKLPGRHKAGEVTLTRGLTGDNSFEKWLRDSGFGTADGRKNGAIIVYDLEGSPLKRYRLINSQLASLVEASPTAGDTSVLTEKLVISYEGLEVE
jgi:phage tail-like protein